MDELELELKTTFLGQAQQLVAEAEQCFLDLESNAGDVKILDRIFRIMHNMKGSANGVGFMEIGDFSHTFESLLLKLKNGEIKANHPMVDLLLKCNDAVTDMVAKLCKDMNATFQYGPLKDRISEVINAGGIPDAPTPKKETNIIRLSEQPSPTLVAPSQPVVGASQQSDDVTDENFHAPSDQSASIASQSTVKNRQATKYKIKFGERFLCFNLGNQEYAIPLLAVKEVIGVPSFTPIPQSPHYFMGITNLRGTVIPVLDLPRKLNIQNKPTSEKAVIILDVGSRHLGIAVDSVNNVVTPRENDLSPRPETDPSVRTDYIIGVYRKDKQMILFIDIATALGTDDWQAIESPIDSSQSQVA